MKVVIRADASIWIGSGHVVRCATLASMLVRLGAEVFFVSRFMPGDLHDWLRNRGFPVYSLEQSDGPGCTEPGKPPHYPWLGTSLSDELTEVSAVLDRIGQVDWLIVDHYALDREWESYFRPRVLNIMAIDDLADRVHDCNILLDQNLYQGAADRYVDLVPEQSTQLLGPGYALLQREYAALRPQAEIRSGYIGKVIVYFGGFNEGGLTLLCTRLLLEKDSPDLYVNVVLNKQHPDYETLEVLAGASNRCSLHSQVPSLAPLMLDSDLAIGASGATCWERCCLGLPSLVVPLSENQRPIARDLETCGYVKVIGDIDDENRDSLIERIKANLSSPLDSVWSERCFSLVDGLGAYRVADSLGLKIEN